MADDPMWTLVMFDAPVQTRSQRRAILRFRNLLLDYGFGMVQFSVYAKYTPAGGASTPVLRDIRANLPPGSKVRILFLTGKQWASMERFSGPTLDEDPETPTQLVFF